MSSKSARFVPVLALLSIANPAWPGAAVTPGDPGAAAPAGRATGTVAPGGMLIAAQHDHIVVVEILPGKAAAAAGLRRGDVLLAVDGVNLIDLDDLSPAAVVGLMDADEEADVRMIIGRGGQTIGVQLVRALINAPSQRSRPPAPPTVGDPAPTFAATDMRGRSVRLEELRGRPLILEFWASWCPPCRASAITLKRFADQFGDRLVIIGVSLDEDRRSFEAFVYNLHLPGYQIYDGGPRGPISTLYEAASAGIPYSILIDPDGTVRQMGSSLQAKEKELSLLLEAVEDGDDS